MTQNEHVYAIFCRLKAAGAGDVITSGNVKTIEGYAVLNFKAAINISFRENKNQPFALCKGPLEPHFLGQGA